AVVAEALDCWTRAIDEGMGRTRTPGAVVSRVTTLHAMEVAAVVATQGSFEPAKETRKEISHGEGDEPGAGRTAHRFAALGRQGRSAGHRVLQEGIRRHRGPSLRRSRRRDHACRDEGR